MILVVYDFQTMCCFPMSFCPLRVLFPMILLSVIVLACGGSGAAQVSSDSSASVPPPPVSDTTLARVDSLDVPARIATTDTLTVHLTGTVGPNGCYSLAGIDTRRTPRQIILRPIVQPPTSDDQMCTMAVVPLDATYQIAPPFPVGSFTLTVPQNDRPPVTTTVEVTDAP